MKWEQLLHRTFGLVMKDIQMTIQLEHYLRIIIHETLQKNLCKSPNECLLEVRQIQYIPFSKLFPFPLIPP
jgi:hypothetical protein